MLLHNDFLLSETQRMVRQEMLHKAAMARLAVDATASRPSWTDRGLACLGRTMVRLGRRLEARVPFGLHGAQP